MKQTIIIAALVFIAGWGGFAVGQNGNDSGVPYAPTRAEWLALHMNVINSDDRLYYSATRDKDEITTIISVDSRLPPAAQSKQLERIELISSRNLKQQIAQHNFEGIQTAKKVLKERTTGNAPFTPSRVEWLVMALNVNHSRDAVTDPGCSITYKKWGPDTVAVICSHNKNAQAIIVERALKDASKLARMTAERYGWGSWLKVIHHKSVIRED